MRNSQTGFKDPPLGQVLGGWYITDIFPPDADPQKRAFWMGRWHMDHDGWQGELAIRRFTDYRSSIDGAPTKLGNYYRDGQRYDVNGRITDDGQSMDFYVADTTAKVQPGSATGQRFDAHVSSFEPDRAAGKTTWNGVEFGLRLSRASAAQSGRQRIRAR